MLLNSIRNNEYKHKGNCNNMMCLVVKIMSATLVLCNNDKTTDHVHETVEGQLKQDMKALSWELMHFYHAFLFLTINYDTLFTFLHHIHLEMQPLPSDSGG